VLAERNQGFMQMTPRPPTGARLHLEQLAEERRPVLYNVVQSFVRHPDAHRAQIAWLIAPPTRRPRVRVASDETAAFAHVRGLNLFDDDPAARATTDPPPSESKSSPIQRPSAPARLSVGHRHRGDP
jgi:hypothetical protein